MNIHTLGHPGRGKARDDVVVGDQHVRWEEVGGLGESGVGLEGTRQDATRDGHHVLGIWSCEKRSLNGQSHAYARTRTRTRAHTHTHTAHQTQGVPWSRVPWGSPRTMPASPLDSLPLRRCVLWRRRCRQWQWYGQTLAGGPTPDRHTALHYQTRLRT